MNYRSFFKGLRYMRILRGLNSWNFQTGSKYSFHTTSHLAHNFHIAWKVSTYGVVFCGPYLSVFGPNVGKYGPEKAPYLDTFSAMPLLKSFGDIALTK